jgi:hypothetical protein
MGHVEGELICIDKLLDSHEEPVGSREGDIEVQRLEDVEFPLDNVLLSELRVSGSRFDHILEAWRIDLFVFLRNKKTSERHLMEICLLASHLLNGNVNELTSHEVGLGKHFELSEEVTQPLEKLSPVLLFDLSCIQEGFVNEESDFFFLHPCIDVCGILTHTLGIP